MRPCPRCGSGRLAYDSGTQYCAPCLMDIIPSPTGLTPQQRQDWFRVKEAAQRGR